MKIIFLDYDGVLNSPAYQRSVARLPLGYEHDFDSKRVSILMKICRKTNAQVIVTSSWRDDINAISYLKSRGIPIVGALPEGTNRGDLIMEWLKNNPVESYLILDDEASPYDRDLMGHTIITREVYDTDLVNSRDYFIGLQNKHLNWAITMLGGKNGQTNFRKTTKPNH